MKTEQYNGEVAKHYAAYRPPLHQLILSRAISPGESFASGLDIGCGTGYSAIALASYCQKVVGLDPNQPMLDQAQTHPKLTYIRGSGEDLGIVPPATIDVVTFAGSLFYAKTERLRTELLRVCTPGAVIIVYDFELLIGQIMAQIGMTAPAVDSPYDHAVNLSGWPEFSADIVRTEQFALELSPTQLAHILLSDSNRFSAFSDKFGQRHPFESVVNYLQAKGSKHHVHAGLYYARYHILHV